MIYDLYVSMYKKHKCVSVFEIPRITVIHNYLFLENEIEARKYGILYLQVSSGINLARTFDSDEISKYLPIAAINRSIV